MNKLAGVLGVVGQIAWLVLVGQHWLFGVSDAELGPWWHWTATALVVAIAFRGLSK